MENNSLLKKKKTSAKIYVNMVDYYISNIRQCRGLTAQQKCAIKMLQFCDNKRLLQLSPGQVTLMMS